jgi:hypothetical protein
LNKTKEVLNLSFISNHDASEILQPGIQSFDLPASLVSHQLAPILCFGLYPVFTMRGDHLDAFFPKDCIQRIAVVGTVSNQSLRFGCDKSRCDSRFHKGDFMRRSTFQVNGDRKTRAVCHCHDLRTFAPLPEGHRDDVVFPTASPLFLPTRTCRQ